MFLLSFGLRARSGASRLRIKARSLRDEVSGMQFKTLTSLCHPITGEHSLNSVFRVLLGGFPHGRRDTLFSVAQGRIIYCSGYP